MTIRFPLLAQQLERAPRKRNITVRVSLAAPDMKEHALGIDVAHDANRPGIAPGSRLGHSAGRTHEKGGPPQGRLSVERGTVSSFYLSFVHLAGSIPSHA